MKKLTFAFLIYFIGCSSHIERESMSDEEFYSELNNKLDSKTLIVYHDKTNMIEGVFAEINSESLSIWDNENYLKIETSEIDSLKYKDGPIILGATIGTVAGIGSGLLLFGAFGGQFDIGGGGNTNFAFVIPITAIVGGIIMGNAVNTYKTIKF